MAKKTVAGNPALDALMPDVVLELAGKKYHLAFTFGAMSVAKKRLREIGIEVNLLRGLDFAKIDVDDLELYFFVALQAGHPEVTLQEASALITMQSYADIFVKCFEAYRASMGPPSKNPDEPAAE